MIEIIKIKNIEIRIWDCELDAPIHHDPKRNSIRLESRKKEWDRVFQCLPIEVRWDDIEKNHLGKPIFKNGNHISISHSEYYAAVAYSNQEVGIDIQVPRPTIFKVRNKFCHPSELLFIGENAQDERYLMLWCAKEATYKIYGHGIDFAKDLYSMPFSSEDTVIALHQQSPQHKNEWIEVHFIKKPHYFVAIAEIKKT